MPLLLRLDEIRTRVQRRSDHEGDSSLSTPEWNSLISEAYRELYGEVEKTGMRHVESVYSITANGAATYALPADHLSTMVFFRVTDTAGSRVELFEIMPQEQTRWSGQSSGDARVYTVIGSSISFYPNPTSGTYEMLYIPQAPDLATAADSTTVDVVNGDGEAFLVYATAVKAMTKYGADISAYIAEREAARERLVDWATRRAFTQPRRRINREVPGYGNSYGFDPINDPGGWWDRG